ncbi:MAG: preprotein translocase subunit YajC [Butyrivibrio sp.]|nr:preprotein translocase subunit YajC [Butyrivibrio sp.]
MGILLTSTGTSATSSGLFWVIYIVAIFGFIYFFFMRPQKKEQKQKAALLSALAVGDSVRTTGGFIGTVIDINDDMVIVEFGNNRNCRIPMVREAIVEIEKPEDAVKPAETKADSKKDKDKKTK